MVRLVWLLAAGLLASACGSSASPGFGDAGSDAGPNDAGNLLPDSGAADGGDAGLGDGGLSDAGGGGPRGLTVNALTVGQVMRSYTAYAPAALPTDGAPLLVILHGAGDTPANFMLETGLQAYADAASFLLAAPAGLNQDWVAGGSLTAYTDDVSFILAVVADVRAHYTIDPKRLYLAGFSKGALLAGGIATTSGAAFNNGFSYTDPFAAVATSCGADFFGPELSLSAAVPKIPFWQIHGDADTTIPFADDLAFSAGLRDGGWDDRFTEVDGGVHTWLWQAAYGHSDAELWAFFLAHPAP